MSIVRRLPLAILPLLCLLTRTVAQDTAVQVPALQPEVQTAPWAVKWWMPRHQQKLKELDALEKVDLLMIGDSITHGWEERGKTVWDKYYAKRNAFNIGFSGDRTEQVLWRFGHGELEGIAPKAAVVMIGTNNTGHRQDDPDETAAGIKAIVDQLGEKLPKTKVLLLAIFPRGESADDELRVINDAINQRISKFADNERVYYLDISDKFLEDDGRLPKSIMPDLLHPNAKGYEIWAEAMEPTLVKLLGEDHVRTVRVLTIGNSLSRDACRYLTDIADSDGSVRIVIGTANIGGCTLEKHASLAAQSQSDSSVKPYQDRRSTRETKFSLQEYLKAEPWDYVTLQQMSALSYKPESFHPHIERLSALVKEHAPDAKILIHQTWAYRPDSPLLEKDNLSQQAMYERLDQAYAAVAKKLGSRIIPVGTAFQIVREVEGREVLVRDPDFEFENPVYPNLPRQTNSLVVGWHWTKKDGKPRLVLDYKHGNTHGCFLAGLVWYEALTGNDARETSYVPKGVDQREAAFYRQIAHLTVAGPRRVAARINRN